MKDKQVQDGMKLLEFSQGELNAVQIRPMIPLVVCILFNSVELNLQLSGSRTVPNLILTTCCT